MEKNRAGVRKGIWTPEEDTFLRTCIESYGEGKWHLVPLRAGLNRCRKSCRLRWLNYLKPNIRRGQFSKDEVDLIIRLHKLLGNRWSLIAGRLPGRTGNDVKNFWNSHIVKKLAVGAAQNFRGRVKAPKLITQSNIARPRPRIFSSVYLCPPQQTTTPETSLPNIVIENPNKNDPLQLPSSSYEADECTRWWSNLLQMSTENELQITDEDHPTDMSVRLVDGDHNPNPQGQGEDVDDGIDDFSIGLVVSELLSLGDER